MKLNEFWDSVSNIGLVTEMPERERIKVRLINQLAFVAVFNSTVFLILHIAVSSPTAIDDLATIVVILFILFLQKNGKFIIARHLSCWLFPTAILFMSVFGQRDFGQSNVFILCAILAFIQYDGQKVLRTTSVIYIGLIGLYSIYYLNCIIPIELANENSFDKIITFSGILIIAFLIIFFYQNDIRILERKKETLILELEKNNDQLVSVNAELDQFTYIASHDLKSPLRNIISFSDLLELKLKRGKTDEAIDHLAFIKSSAKQMKFLIEDILEFSKIDKGDNTKKELIDLNKIVDKVSKTLKQEIDEKRANIIHEELPFYFCNEVQVSLLFQNLIQNGIKYNTSKVPIIKIKSTNEKGILKIYFKDNGIGIEEEYHEKIFEFFKRLHSSNQFEGTGIGLGLCNKIVQSMDGKISLKSVIGTGSEFIIELPVVPSNDLTKYLESPNMVQHSIKNLT